MNRWRRVGGALSEPLETRASFQVFERGVMITLDGVLEGGGRGLYPPAGPFVALWNDIPGLYDALGWAESSDPGIILVLEDVPILGVPRRLLAWLGQTLEDVLKRLLRRRV